MMMKVSVVSLILLLLVIDDVVMIKADQHMMIESNKLGCSLLQDMDCDSACKVRCSESGRPKICKRACGTCCARCHCVPPGTSGNEDVCPCYANMTTHGGKHKCP